MRGDEWEKFFVRNGTNVVQAPYHENSLGIRRQLVKQLNLVASKRQENEPLQILAKANLSDESLESALSRGRTEFENCLGRLVFLQEELDWSMYRTFGIATDIPILGVDEPRVLRRGDRPFEIALARRVSRGEEETKWFDRHEINPVTDISADYDELHRIILEKRLDRIEQDETLAVLEQPLYKRRWSQILWADRVRLAAMAFNYRCS